MDAYTDADMQVAVDAAVDVWDTPRPIALGVALAVLDAVTPAIAARAKAEALDAAVDAIRHNERECLVEHTCHLADIISLGYRADKNERTP